VNGGCEAAHAAPRPREPHQDARGTAPGVHAAEGRGHALGLGRPHAGVQGATREGAREPRRWPPWGEQGQAASLGPRPRPPWGREQGQAAPPGGRGRRGGGRGPRRLGRAGPPWGGPGEPRARG
jgi:hypothetical protein